MLTKYEWMQRIKAVEREYAAMRFASNYLMNEIQRNPGVLVHNLRRRDVVESRERLEGTYTIRIFAEFETCLRNFWLASRPKDPPQRTRDLVEGVGAKRKIPYDQICDAHLVRDYRNSLVHERDEELMPITIVESGKYLCTFLGFLPLEW